MANNCYVNIHAVAVHKKDLQYLRDLMRDKGKDGEYLNAYNGKLHKPFKRDDGKYEGVITAICPWTCTDLYNGNNEFGRGHDPKKTSMLEFCKKYNVGAECWAQEYGFGFQQHFVIDCNGNVLVDLESRDCEFDLDDQEEIVEGGFEDFWVHVL